MIISANTLMVMKKHAINSTVSGNPPTDKPYASSPLTINSKLFYKIKDYDSSKSLNVSLPKKNSCNY